MLKGIDVSEFQGDINWEVVKPQIDFAILRCGFGGDLAKWDDKKFKRNADECTRLGIPFGVYLYSYALNIENANQEADHCLRMIKGYKPSYPIYIDMEDASQLPLSKALRTDIAITFMERLESAGYFAGVYANLDWLNNKLDDNRLQPYTRWLAQWTSNPTYKRDFALWQYTSSGSINGINGRIDMNYSYTDFPTIIKKAGLNGYEKPVVIPPVIVPIPEPENPVIEEPQKEEEQPIENKPVEPEITPNEPIIPTIPETPQEEPKTEPKEDKPSMFQMIIKLIQEIYKFITKGVRK